jgi:hypothetical protein
MPVCFAGGPWAECQPELFTSEEASMSVRMVRGLGLRKRRYKLVAVWLAAARGQQLAVGRWLTPTALKAV